jgi:hypothetical protein
MVCLLPNDIFLHYDITFCFVKYVVKCFQSSVTCKIFGNILYWLQLSGTFFILHLFQLQSVLSFMWDG